VLPNASSAEAKLCEITSARWLSTTYFSAAIICGKPWTPSVSAVGVWTSRMLAPGAIACEVSTSSATSSAHALLSSWPVLLLLDGGAFVAGEPCSVSSLNFGMPGAQVTPSSPHIDASPNAWLNTCRSWAIVSLPYESTIAIVRPVPFLPPAYRGSRLYDAWIACGAKQRRPVEAHCACVGGVSDFETCS